MTPFDADLIQFLALQGDRQSLIEVLGRLTASDTALRPKMQAGEALEMRRRQFAVLTRKDMAALLHVTPVRYNDFIQGHRPIPKLVMARAYALGTRVEPLLGIEKPRSLYFSL
jgi:plasmid maintenance system antidote protein VapI